MSNQRSFQDILEEKLQKNKSHPPAEAPKEALSSAKRAAQEMRFWKIQGPEMRIPLGHRDAVNAFASPPSKPIEKPVELVIERWSEEQQQTLQQLIAWGAKIETNSPLTDIKKAYRQLLLQFHPDHCRSEDEFTQKRYARMTEKIVLCFREFEKSVNSKEAQRPAA